MTEVVEYHDVEYTVILTVRDDADGDPTPEEIASAIYQGVRDIDTEDAILVERSS